MSNPLGEEGKLKVKSRFTEGVRLLGGEYVDFGEDKLYKLRCGLIHGYLPKIKGFNSISIANDSTSDRTFWVASKDSGLALAINMAKLVADLSDASKRLRHELEKDRAKRDMPQVALSRLPELA